VSPSLQDYQDNSTQQSNILGNQTTAATSRIMNSIDLSDSNLHHHSSLNQVIENL